MYLSEISATICKDIILKPSILPVIWHIYCILLHMKENSEVTNGKKILIVDDDQLILFSLAKAFERLCNFSGEVKTVENGNDALKEINTDTYDICFLDINLPDINGLDIMKRINSSFPEIKIIIMTAHDITTHIKKEIDEYAFHFISKPFEISQIKTIFELASENHDSSKNNNMFKETRKFIRMPFKKSINCSTGIYKDSELKIENLIVYGVDISDGGIGIRTNYHLKPGNMISLFDENVPKTGLIKWIKSSGNVSFRAGIEFSIFT